MLEFARHNWLWLFALVAAFYVAWWFARRYRKRRVTYGRIWERVAKRVLPPAWKRILRTLLTLLTAGVMLSSVALFAAGLQRPEDEAVPPVLVVIFLDNSPSMQAVHDGRTRAETAQDRAQQIVDALGDDDRAVLAWSRGSRCMIGAWLTRGDAVGDPPPVDFRVCSLEESRLAGKQLRPPPDLPESPKPELEFIYLTDTDEPAPGHYVETFGTSAENRFIVSAKYLPPEPGAASSGVIEFDAVGEADARLLPDGEYLEVFNGTVELPIRVEPLQMRLAVPDDVLPHDNSVGMSLSPSRLARIVLCYPAGDGEANPLLKQTLQQFLPGREVRTQAVPGDPVDCDLLICDRALPEQYDARFMLCFGVLPQEYGRVAPSVEAEPNMQLREDFDGVGFEVPELTLLNARAAVPLEAGHTLTPIVRHIEGGTLIGASRYLLYCGYIPHQSTLLQDISGFLLLYRWLNSLQSAASRPFPPFVPWDRPTEFQLDEAGELRLSLVKSPWLPAYGAREYTLTTGPDGRGEIGPFEIPGVYSVSRGGREVARFTAVWNDEHEQNLDVTPREPVDLQVLLNQQLEPDWRDTLPGALLWIALVLIVLEWVLWLAGVTE